MSGSPKYLAAALLKRHSLLLVVLLFVVFSYLSPRFLTGSNLQNILTASAAIGLIAFGATFVIANGGIDLSTGSVMALSSTITALTLQSYELPPFAAVALSVLSGGLCGSLSGILINVTGAPSFIVTLGMLSMTRATAYIISNASPIYGLSESVTLLGQQKLYGISGAALFLVIGAAIAFILLHKTRFGAHTLICGDNSFVADAMGINSNLLRLRVFTLAGMYSGAAGFIFMARTNSGEPAAGQNYELLAITSVILGGANLFGGRASILGTTAGVLCLGVLQNGLNLLAVSTYYQTLFVGFVLIVAAFLSKLSRREA